MWQYQPEALMSSSPLLSSSYHLVSFYHCAQTHRCLKCTGMVVATTLWKWWRNQHSFSRGVFNRSFLSQMGSILGFLEGLGCEGNLASSSEWGSSPLALLIVLLLETSRHKTTAEEGTAKGLGAIRLQRQLWSSVTCGLQISTHSVNTERHKMKYLTIKVD